MIWPSGPGASTRIPGSRAFMVSRNVACVPTRSITADNPGRFHIGSGVNAVVPVQQPQAPGVQPQASHAMSMPSLHDDLQPPVLRTVGIIVEFGDFPGCERQYAVFDFLVRRFIQAL